MTTKTKRNLFGFLTLILHNQTGSLMGGEPGGDNPPPAGGEPGGDNPPPAGDDIPWPTTLDPVLKGDKTLLRHYNAEKKEFDIPGIMKSLVHTKSLVGAEKIAKPQKNWNEDNYRDFYRQVGLPESVDMYNIENKGLPEGTKADEEFFNTFKEKAYESGLLPQQAEKLVEWFNTANAAKTQAVHESIKQEFETAKMKLQQEFGTALQSKLAVGFEALKMFATDSEVEILRDKGLLDDPDISRLLIRVAENMNDDKFDPSIVKGAGMTPNDAAEKLKDLYKQDTARMSPSEKKAWTEQVGRYAALKNQSGGQKGNRTAIL